MKNKLTIFLIACCTLGLSYSCSKDPIVTTPSPGKPIPIQPNPGGENNGGGTPYKYNIPSDLKPYYADIDFTKTGKELKTQLSNKVTSTHKKTITYKQVWTAVKQSDFVPNANPEQVYLIYGHKEIGLSPEKQAYTREMSKQASGGPSVDTWNREHVFTQHAGGFNTKQPGAGTDAHNIRAADTDWNSARANRKFAEGKGNSTPIGQDSWYPGDLWKGSVARMMMYMYVRYGEQCAPTKIGQGKTTSFDNMIDLFLKWNAQVKVSESEKRRNDYLSNVNNEAGQGNRNPFIDNPYLATHIWGGPKADNHWK
ncbi:MULTISPECIES: endonuclease I family protein [Myroides]|uniref:Endonuclease n=1 Tax=Myroides albus TaxID=2562892 RepID=A0A6I3LPC3_9FLAO|nr:MULTISPECIES: endonuclease [Myroides]MTG99276.1 endonuclease [Myroides albus]MVX37100.1 endonuclease [Myroides sp. LoEW2-1]UVD78857.1 endonuclease [Myroides albus]